jgi:hypothetical protein
MNPTTENLQAQYAARFLVTTACVGAAVITARLIWLGKIGDYLLPATGIAIVITYAAWRGTVDLCRRWKQLKQFSVLQKRGPYGTREYIPPRDARRDLGDDDPNMWG